MSDIQSKYDKAPQSMESDHIDSIGLTSEVRVSRA
jgi:hypothetical protein